MKDNVNIQGATEQISAVARVGQDCLGFITHLTLCVHKTSDTWSVRKSRRACDDNLTASQAAFNANGNGECRSNTYICIA